VSGLELASVVTTIEINLQLRGLPWCQEPAHDGHRSCSLRFVSFCCRRGQRARSGRRTICL